ncbi:MAG TPA: hypothetical protein VGK45_10530 [Thermoanaerobaculia bacterium]
MSPVTLCAAVVENDCVYEADAFAEAAPYSTPTSAETVIEVSLVKPADCVFDVPTVTVTPSSPPAGVGSDCVHSQYGSAAM